jgi:transposase
LVQERSQSKNRIHAVLAGYNLRAPVTDLFGKAGRAWLQGVLSGEQLRTAAQRVITDHLAIIDYLDMLIEALEKDLKNVPEQKEAVKLLKTIPGVGQITATTMIAEIGDIQRFHSPKALCNWAGLTPASAAVRGSPGTVASPKKDLPSCEVR